MVSIMKIVDTKEGALRPGLTAGVQSNRPRRRTYTVEYKRDVVRQCGAAGVSVAGVALAHGINANLVRRWMVRQRGALARSKAQSNAVLLAVNVQPESLAHERPRDDGLSPAAKPRRTAMASIEIELNGARIHLRDGVDAQALSVVVDVLSRR